MGTWGWLVNMNILLKLFILVSASTAVFALKCYKCDGVKGEDLPCDGASGKGKEVDCEDKCGLLLEARLPRDKWGCQQVSQRSEDRLIVRHTLCLCNSTLCNEDKSPAPAMVPSLLTISITIASIVFSLA